MSKLHIGDDEHVFIAGRTGSGKSMLAGEYLRNAGKVFALDSKGTLTWPQVPEDQKTIITRISEISKTTTQKVIYRPIADEMEDEFYDQFFEYCYFHGNCKVWIDEAMAVCPNPHRIPRYYKAILTRGRELNVTAYSLSQRPSGIPLVVMSEATHFFIFDLNMERDRKTMVEITGCSELMAKPDKFVFWYYNVNHSNAYQAKLTLKKGGQA